MHILGVRIDNLSKNEILARIKFFLRENKFHQIATVNPEFILLAKKNAKFKSILNKCDLNIADGVGVWYAFIRNFLLLKTRFTGVELIDYVLEMANQERLTVYLAISNRGLSSYEEILYSLGKKFPNVKFMGNTHDSIHLQKIDCNEAIDVLICNFGAPWQEMFIDLQKNGKIKLAVGIGGAFDFFTKKVKRAPKILQLIGLEWLYRLIQEPSYRFKRIINAVIIFPLAVIFLKNNE